MGVEETVARHYASGSLLERLLDVVRRRGKDPEQLQPDDFAGLDELHSGGRAATAAFAPQLGLTAGMHLLDVGAGIGGPARYFATHAGCRVTGIDLTPEFVDVARALSARCGLGDRVAFHAGSALAMPFPAGSFDAATMLHVGMNIADKAALFREVRRVLKPGAVFGIYDVMRQSDGAFAYPVPWADSEASSFPATLAEYERWLAEAGFRPEWHKDFRPDMPAFFAAQQAATAAAGADAATSVSLVMGDSATTRVANMRANFTRGVAAPTGLVSRAI